MAKHCTTPDQLLAGAFRRFGLFVAKYPIVFIVVPAAIACMLGSGVLLKDRVHQIDVDYLYAPTSSTYLVEKDLLYSIWPIDPDHYTPWSIISFRQMTHALLHVRENAESKNMLELSNLESAERFNDYVMNNITALAEMPQFFNGTSQMVLRNVTFRDICLRFKNICSFSNEHLTTMYSRVKFGGDRLTYPKTKFGDKSILLATGIGGVETNTNAELIFVKTVGMVYHVRHDAMYASATLKWEKAFVSFMEKYNQNQSNALRGFYIVSTSLNEGLEQNAEAIKPKFIISVAIMILFVVICSLKLTHINGKRPTLDIVQSKPMLALCGVITAALGIVSAQGLLMLAGYDFSSATEIMPFLILSIGVDDMFILTAAWRETDASKPVEVRVSDSLAESAVPITITSLTNAISFAIGIGTPIRAVQIFSVYTSVGIVANYVMQVTFFVGCMTIAGKWEAAGRSSIFPCMKVAIDESNTASETEDILHKFVRHHYAPLLSTMVVRIGTAIVICVYVLFAVWGTFQLEEGMKQDNLMLNDYYGSKFYKYYRETILATGTQAEIIVRNVPDLSKPEDRATMEVIVRAFEELPITMDHGTTEFWMRDYLNASPTPKNTIKDWTWRVHRWSNLASNEKTYSQAFSWRNATSDEFEAGCHCAVTGVIDAFRFKIGMRNFGNTNNQKRAVVVLRNVANGFKHNKVSTYMGEYAFLDQYLIILPVTLKNMGIAIACMIVVSLILIPNPICIVWIVLTIISIDTGVIGYMAWWDVSLDTVSMITIIMSIGFSVDYSAHITYGFVTAKGSSNHRLVQAITHLGLPVLQGASSTILGVTILSTVNSYIVQTFFKTIFLVIVFGMIHACIVLPVMLGATYDAIQWCTQNHKVTPDVDIPDLVTMPEIKPVRMTLDDRKNVIGPVRNNIISIEVNDSDMTV